MGLFGDSSDDELGDKKKKKGLFGFLSDSDEEDKDEPKSPLFGGFLSKLGNVTKLGKMFNDEKSPPKDEKDTKVLPVRPPSSPVHGHCG